MNKNIILLIFIISFLGIKNLFGFSIMERLEMPSNSIYFNKFSIKLNKIEIKKKKLVKLEKKVQKENKEKFNLTGIFKIGDNFYAILNGNTFSTGETIHDFIIKSIELKKVILYNKKNKKRLVLKIEN